MSEKQQLHADEILIELLRNQAGTPFSNTEIRDLYLSRIPPVSYTHLTLPTILRV